MADNNSKPIEYNDFAESIKAKYPQYRDIDNLALAKKIVEKYPQYKVNFPSSFSDQAQKAIQSAGQYAKNTVQGAGRELAGLQQMAGKIANPIQSGLDVGRGAAQVYSENQSIMEPGRGAKAVLNQGIVQPAVQAGQGLLNTFKHPINSFEQSPIGTALTLIPAAKLAMSGLGALGGAGIAAAKSAVTPEIDNAVMKAIKPSVYLKNVPKDISIVNKEVFDNAVKNKMPIATLEDYDKSLKMVMDKAWGDYEAIKKTATTTEEKSLPMKDIKSYAETLKNNAMRDYQQGQGGNFSDQLRQITNGISPYKKGINGKVPELHEYANDIPNKFKNRSGMPLDEVVQTYNDTFGEKFDENSFIREMQKYANARKPSNNINDYIDEARNHVDRMLGEGVISGDPIANSIREPLLKRVRPISPQLQSEIENQAKFYEGRNLTIQEADQALHEVNNDLKSFYQQKYGKQLQNFNDPSTRHLVNEAKALREGIDSKLKDLTGESGKQFRELYGKLAGVRNAVQDRLIVANRQQPFSLQESVNKPLAIARGVYGAVTGNPAALVESAAQYGASSAIKELNSTNGLIRGAFERYKAKMGITPSAGAKVSVPARQAAQGLTGATLISSSRDNQ